MPSKGARKPLGATDSSPRPGCFPLVSAQSRAAARAMLEVRQESEGGLRFQVVSVVDGKPVHLDGLAERAARAQGPESMR